MLLHFPRIALLITLLSFSTLAAQIFSYSASSVKTVDTDNLWDGVNRQGQIQVFSRTQWVPVEGPNETPYRFGACPRVGDITGDGKPELVIGDAAGFVWIFDLTPASPHRTVTNGRFIPSYFGDCLTVALADWNNDKLLDLICGDVGGYVSWCKNLGGGQFTTADGVPAYFLVTNAFPWEKREAFPLVLLGREPLNVGRFSAPYAAQLLRDGRLHLLVGDGSYSANSVYLFRNTGSPGLPAFSSPERYWLAYGSGREQLVPALGDLDADGDLDLLVGDRLGNVHLYLNQPLNSSDPKERYLMTYQYPLDFEGNRSPVGPLVRPELTDWDGDGDLDLLLGAGDGRVYLALNNGSPTEHLFLRPQPLTSPDILKPYRAPEGVNVDYMHYLVTPRWNSGAYLSMSSETSEDGSSRSFIRYTLFNNYAGFMQKIIWPFQIKFPVGKHTFLITCRARNYKRITVELHHHETAKRAKSDTLLEAWPMYRFDIKPSPSWQTLRVPIEIKPEFRENDGLLTVIHKSVFTQVDPQPGLEFDISEIRVE
ncbi:MAG: VCBS repeat-containing protein [bacterium]|nr:VCBS repeat-containing protein [bacterium]